MPNRILNNMLGGKYGGRSSSQQQTNHAASAHDEAEQPQPEDSELPTYDESTSTARTDSTLLTPAISHLTFNSATSDRADDAPAPSPTPPPPPPPSAPLDDKKTLEPVSAESRRGSIAESSTSAFQPQYQPSAPSILIRNPQSLLSTALKFHQTLIATATSSSAPIAPDDEPQIITIHPHNQQVYLELHNHDAESFSANSIAVKIQPVHRNHWVTSDPSDKSHHTSPPPLPLRVPRLVLGSDVLTLWTEYAHAQQQHAARSGATHDANQYMHLITVEGLSGPVVRKYLAVPAVNLALSAVFQEVANGYSVVFVAVMLRDEWERSLGTENKRFAQCGSAGRLVAYRDRDGTGSGTGGSGLGLPPPGYARRKEEERRDFGIMF